MRRDETVRERIERLARVLADAELDGLLITRPSNRQYVTGFSGSAGTVLVTADGAWLFTDFRYEEQAAQQAPDVTVVRISRDLEQRVAEVLAKARVSRLGFESDHAVYDAVQSWRNEWAAELVPRKGLVEKLRAIKDDGELEAIARSVRITDQAFAEVLPVIRPGVTERAIARELSHAIAGLGGDGLAFDMIVASGPRGALPHGRASDRVIEHGDLVTIDVGTYVDGYASDMTRTVAVGAVDERQREIYQLVLSAQEAGVEAVRPGLTGAEVDRAARDIIVSAGYGEHFGHGLGHGVGLDVHEQPGLSPHAQETVLSPGMVVTVEPGIYIPGWGGVRIEDIVVVTEDGARVLTGTTKELLVL